MHPSFKMLKSEDERKGKDKEEGKKGEEEKREKENYHSIINTKVVFQKPSEVSMIWNIGYSFKFVMRKVENKPLKSGHRVILAFFWFPFCLVLSSPIPLLLAF